MGLGHGEGRREERPLGAIRDQQPLALDIKSEPIDCEPLVRIRQLQKPGQTPVGSHPVNTTRELVCDHRDGGGDDDPLWSVRFREVLAKLSTGGEVEDVTLTRDGDPDISVGIDPRSSGVKERSVRAKTGSDETG